MIGTTVIGIENMLWKIEIRLLAILMACVTNAHAQSSVAPAKPVQPAAAKSQANSEPLEVKLVRSKVVLIDGKETHQSAAVAKPGDILEEIATYSNKSRAPLSSLEATLPVPANTELLMASIKPGNAKASIDGSQFFNLPLKRKVKLTSGIEAEQLVPVSEYRYLRWYPGDLSAEKSLAFSARFKVSDNIAAAVSPAGK